MTNSVKKEDFIKAYESGLTLKQIADKFNFSVSTVQNYAKHFNLKRGKGNSPSRRKIQL